MNGPQHYRRAEQLEQLAIVQYEQTVVDEIPHLANLTMAQAQVHATLALAAATVDQIAARGPGDIAAACTDAIWPHSTGESA